MNPIQNSYYGATRLPQANTIQEVPAYSPALQQPLPSKQFLEIIKKGNLGEIIGFIGMNKLDITKIIDGNFRHTCLFYASLIPDPEASYQVMKAFVERGISPTYTDILNQTVIYYAAREGKTKCVQYLISMGCDANHRDQYGQTPLYYAAREGHYDLCKILIDAGADVNSVDANGQTALFYAAREGKRDICELFINYGVDVNKQDNRKQTALNWAKKYNRPNVVDLLLLHGAIPIGDPIQKFHKEKPLKKADRKVKKVPVETNSLRKYVLTIYKDGEWKKLSPEEFKQFEDNNKQLAQYFKNPSLLSSIKPPADPNANITYHWDKAATKILNYMWKLRDARHFHQPVDYVAMKIYDYPQVISHPMDFGTIKSKIENGSYTNCKEFIDDMELVFSNCITYNNAESDFGYLAKKFQEEFRNQCQMNCLEFYMT